MNKRYTGRPSLKWLFEDADPNKIPNDKFPMQLSAVKAELAKQLATSGADDKDKGNQDDVVGVNKASFACSELAPSQTSMNIDKAWQFALSMMNGSMPGSGGPGGDLNSFISNDNYIMDGHHRWIATGMVDPNAQLTGFKVNLPGQKLVAVLNTVTKGLLGIEAGNPATGGFDQFKNAAAVKAALERQLGGQAGKTQGPIGGDQSPEGVKNVLIKWTGVNDPNTVVDAAVQKVVANLQPLLAKPLMPNAPGREDMPVIDDQKAAGATAKTVKALQQGEIDLNPPFSTEESGAASEEKKEEPQVVKESAWSVDRWQVLAGIRKR